MNEDLLQVVYGDDNSNEVIKDNNEVIEDINEDDENKKLYCTDCGELIEGNNFYTLPNGGIICESCYCDNYFTCDKCGEIHHQDDCIIINNGDYFVCEDCAERYCYKCMECGNWFTGEGGYTDSNGDFLCNECLNNYVICDKCGEFVHVNDLYIDSGNYYCSYCYDNMDHTIYNYHSFEDWEFKNTSNNSLIDTSIIYYGLEIEVSGDKNCAERTQELLDGNAVLMHDGSVDGFEIVTHPMTLNYFYDEFLTPLNNTLNYLKDNNFKGHNNGGIHIHVSKCALLNDYNDAIKKLRTILSKNNMELWITLTQRREDKLMQWAGLYPLDNNTRYQAVNEDSRTNTIEFRIFNSSLRLDRIIKNFQIVTSLIDYVNENCTTDYYKDINNYINYVFNNRFKYMNLYSFMIEKQIIKMEDLLLCA